MINKIKDKQTGEYHDIGGLKCKLVAEGTLLSSNGVYNEYRLSQAVKPNTNYLVHAYCGDMGLSANCIIMCDETSQGASSGCWWDANDTAISTIYVLGATSKHDTLMLIHKYDGDDMYASYDDYIKIYELPFALEV